MSEKITWKDIDAITVSESARRVPGQITWADIDAMDGPADEHVVRLFESAGLSRDSAVDAAKELGRGTWKTFEEAAIHEAMMGPHDNRRATDEKIAEAAQKYSGLGSRATELASKRVNG